MGGLIYHGRVCFNNLFIRVRFNKNGRIITYHCCSLTFIESHWVLKFYHKANTFSYLHFPSRDICILSIDDRYFLRRFSND